MKYLLEINYIIWLVFSALFFSCGEYFSKKFALNPSFTYVLYIALAYFVGTMFWLPALMQRNQLSIVGAMWSVLSLLMTVFIGVVLFKEGLSALGIVGIVLALISIVVLALA